MPDRLVRLAGLPIAVLLAILFALETLDDGFFMEGGRYFLAAIALGLALALPWRFAMIYLGFCAAASAGIIFINDVKISLTEMPLTFLDLRIAFANPEGFLGAMKCSWLPAALAASVVASLSAGSIYWCFLRWRRSEIRDKGAARAVAIGVAGVLAAVSVTIFAERLEAAVMRHEYAEIANTPDGLLLIANKVGAVPFLALSAQYDATTSAPFRSLTTGSPGKQTPHPDRLPDYVKSFKAPVLLPNIVVVLLESTFDLPRVFNVTPEVRSDLFPISARGQLQGELGVNAIGGGTWISEFEAITGIPSRLFGYAGYYTHVELAPYLKASLATHLRAKGYRNLGLYAVEGAFYGARSAYARYGFETFHDSADLGIEKPWTAEDTDIMAKYIEVIGRTDSSSPVFAFALTMENHSPHPCTRFGSEAEMPYRFVGGASSRATCELNEYVARYRSTELAIANLERALRERQSATGRPYVLAIFGDHQPNSFTGTAKSPFWTPEDYSKLRRAPNDVTFYQIRSSLPSPFAVGSLDIPIVMLPTLISAYVAKDSSDLYLPGNFELQAQCGEKIALPRLNTAYGKDAMVPQGEKNAAFDPVPLAESCRGALIEARTDYDKLIEMP
jgi:phosphoglycerol transferase MdoB-like AlkP superfamily enzyme